MKTVERIIASVWVASILFAIFGLTLAIIDSYSDVFVPAETSGARP